MHPVCHYISLCSVLLISCQAKTFQQPLQIAINKFISSVCWCVCACAHWGCASSWPESQQHPCTALRCRGSSGTSCLDHTQEQKHLQLLLWVFCCAFCSASASIHLPAGLVHCAVIHPAHRAHSIVNHQLQTCHQGMNRFRACGEVKTVNSCTSCKCIHAHKYHANGPHTLNSSRRQGIRLQSHPHDQTLMQTKLSPGLTHYKELLGSDAAVSEPLHGSSLGPLTLNKIYGFTSFT